MVLKNGQVKYKRGSMDSSDVVVVFGLGQDEIQEMGCTKRTAAYDGGKSCFVGCLSFKDDGGGSCTGGNDVDNGVQGRQQQRHTVAGD